LKHGSVPQRQEYDLEGAAEYLGCSTGDILYYLDKGLLRLSVSTEHSPDFVSVPFEKLSAAVQQLLQSLYNPDGIDLSRIKLDQASLDAGGAVTSLYLTHHQRNKIKDTVHQLGEPIWLFQDFAGEQITIWYEDSLRGFWFYEEGGWISLTTLTKEELDRFSGPLATKEEEHKPAYAVPPKKPNEQSWVIVKYANEFYWEFGEFPQPKAFGKYLEVHAKKEGFCIRSEEQMRSPDAELSERDKYDFNGYGMSERSLGRALRAYRIEDESTK